MTEIELRFMQMVPSRLKGIEEQLTRIANALEKIAEGSADVGVKCNKK